MLIIPDQAIEFHVRGRPRPAGSKRVFPIRKDGVLTGKFVVTDMSGKEGKSWRSSIQDSAVQAKGFRVLKGALELDVCFVLARPKAHFGTGKNSGSVKASAPYLPSIRPDITKLVRAVEDALNGLLWGDDAQITYAIVKKVYGPYMFYPGGVAPRDEMHEGCVVKVLYFTDAQ